MGTVHSHSRLFPVPGVPEGKNECVEGTLPLQAQGGYVGTKRGIPHRLTSFLCFLFERRLIRYPLSLHIVMLYH
jgi:hypothetical protein